MAERHSREEKKFSIPDSPLEVRLSIHYDQPPELRVVIYGPKRNEHKDPNYVNAINYLIDELKAYIAISGWFPAQGRFVIDKYDNDGIALHIRYPSDSSLRYSSSLLDVLIRAPLSRSQLAKKNKKSAEKLFDILSEKLPLFIGDLASVMEKDRYSFSAGKRKAQAREIKISKENKEAYDLLGVTPNTPWETIKKTFHDKARKAHPDANHGVDDGSFHKLKDAYEMLKKLHQNAGK